MPTTPTDKMLIPPINPIKIINEAHPEEKPIKSFEKKMIKINIKETSETNSPTKQIKIRGSDEKLVQIFNASLNFFKKLYEL